MSSKPVKLPEQMQESDNSASKSVFGWSEDTSDATDTGTEAGT